MIAQCDRVIAACERLAVFKESVWPKPIAPAPPKILKTYERPRLGWVRQMGLSGIYVCDTGKMVNWAEVQE